MLMSEWLAEMHRATLCDVFTFYNSDFEYFKHLWAVIVEHLRPFRIYNFVFTVSVTKLMIIIVSYALLLLIWYRIRINYTHKK